MADQAGQELRLERGVSWLPQGKTRLQHKVEHAELREQSERRTQHFYFYNQVGIIRPSGNSVVTNQLKNQASLLLPSPSPDKGSAFSPATCKGSASILQSQIHLHTNPSCRKDRNIQVHFTMLAANQSVWGVHIEKGKMVQYLTIWRYFQSLKQSILHISKKHLHKKACSNLTTLLVL